MKNSRVPFMALGLALVYSLLAFSAAFAAVDKVICVPWQGDPLKYHTAISGVSAKVKGVIKTTNTATIWYKWAFGDGSETAVSSLSGATKYNVEAAHTYTAAKGTPFTATLLVDGVDSSMANAVTDNYLIKIEEDILDARVNLAIDNGLWYLFKNQYVSASNYSLNAQPVAVWSSYSSYYASPTASAVLAFEINNHKATGNAAEDPYVEAVKNGLNWLLNGYYGSTSYPMLQAVAISSQTYGNPDVNGNGKGIQVRDYSSNPAYEGGMVMDAIIASGTPDADSGRDFDGDGATDTYQKVIQDMIDMYSWGQSDFTDTRGGGWRYSWNSDSDNSVCQWAAIGMIPAETTPAHMGAGPDGVMGTADDVVIDYWGTIPAWVKARNDVWLTYSYSVSNRYFGYTSSTVLVNSNSQATRPSGMVQMVMSVANYKSDSRWIGAESWFTDNWTSFIGNRTYYGWYAFVKAMRLSNTENLSNGFNWYRGTNGIAPKLIAEQETDGSWPQGGQTTHPGYYGDNFVTAWAIGMLKPALFAAAPVACFTAHPNPNYANMPIYFDPTCSGHTETGKNIGNLTLFQWDWDNDGNYDEFTSSPDVVTHSFACAVLPCTYPVTLKVTDDATPPLTATYTLSINISNPPHPPVADAGGPYMTSLCVGETLKLDGSGSFDPNEGQHEAGCTTCPNDTITAWNWDLVPPLTDFSDKAGKTVTLNAAQIASYFTSGLHNIGLQVTDNTALAYPSSGEPNLTDVNFGTVNVYDAYVCDLTARVKCGKVQLTWTHTGAANYDIYRSTEGPNSGFVLLVNDHVTSYATYLDTAVVNGITYYYRVVSSDGCGSKWVSARPTTR